MIFYLFYKRGDRRKKNHDSMYGKSAKIVRESRTDRRLKADRKYKKETKQDYSESYLVLRL